MNKSESKYYNTSVKMDEAFISLLEKKDFDYITVKEICESAGVNRSTFYLHYETIQDLLQECVEYISTKFSGYFDVDIQPPDLSQISNCPIEDLIFITPDILIPYLSFIRQNKVLFKVAVEHSEMMGSVKTFEMLYNRIFEPILKRFNFRDNERKFVIAFYINGIIAIIMEWLKENCRTSIEEISSIIVQCSFPAMGDKLRKSTDG